MGFPQTGNLERGYIRTLTRLRRRLGIALAVLLFATLLAALLKSVPAQSDQEKAINPGTLDEIANPLIWPLLTRPDMKMVVFTVGKSRRDEEMERFKRQSSRQSFGRCGIKRNWGPQPLRCDYPQDPETIYSYMAEMAARYNINLGLLKRIAHCEGWVYSANTSSSASGIFQFLGSTWARTAWRDRDVFDPFANIEAAASHIAAHGTGAWDASARCWK